MRCSDTCRSWPCPVRSDRRACEEIERERRVILRSPCPSSLSAVLVFLTPVFCRGHAGRRLTTERPSNHSNAAQMSNPAAFDCFCLLTGAKMCCCLWHIVLFLCSLLSFKIASWLKWKRTRDWILQWIPIIHAS